MKWWWVPAFAALIALALALIVVVRAIATDAPRAGTARGNADDRRLRAYFQEGRDYRFYVTVPDTHPAKWQRVEQLEQDQLVMQSGNRIPLRDAPVVLVTYANGEVLDSRGTIHSLPDGTFYSSPAPQPLEHEIDPSLLAKGAAFIEVTHGAGVRARDGRWEHSTSVRNVSAGRVRILKFGGYHRERGRWVLATITGSFFTAEQFRSWYGVNGSDWLEPGETVTDPHNYGSKGSLWAYFGEAESGHEFVAGSTVD